MVLVDRKRVEETRRNIFDGSMLVPSYGIPCNSSVSSESHSDYGNWIFMVYMEWMQSSS